MRARETDLGDLAFNFDPNDFFPNEQRSLDQKSVRLGLRYSPTINSDGLLSFTYADRDETVSDRFDTLLGPGVLDGDLDEDGYRVEGQYVWRQQIFSLIGGIAYAETDARIDALVTLGGISLVDVSGHENTNHLHPYVYGNLNLPRPVTWTVGLSYDDFEQETLEVTEANPKFGISWQLTDELRLRGALAQMIKPPIATNQILEPTRVAGFNQLSDDANRDESLRYGVGLDWQPQDDLFFGAEATWRDVKTSFFDDSLGESVLVDQWEQTHRAYAFWNPWPEWAFGLELAYDRFKAERSLLTVQDDVPEQVETWSVPLSVRYFHPSGFFAGLRGTFVDQQVAATPGNLLDRAEGSDSFFVVDATTGYRLPNRLGVASIAVHNLLDTGFHYQDDSYREFSDSPSIGPYIPDLQIVGRVTLNW